MRSTAVSANCDRTSEIPIRMSRDRDRSGVSYSQSRRELRSSRLSTTTMTRCAICSVLRKAAHRINQHAQSMRHRSPAYGTRDACARGMYMRTVSSIITIGLGLLFTSCGQQQIATGSPDKPRDGPHGRPELPRLESRPLVPIPHGSLMAPKIGTPSGMHPRTVNMVAPEGRRIDLKLLVITALGDEPAFLAARSALDRIGVPYDVLIAATSTLTPAMLSNDIDHCNYRGIVVAVGGLGLADPSTGSWGSAFTTAEWTTLADFERACSARELVWYGWPGAEFGLAVSSSFGPGATVTALVTPAGVSVFPYIQASAAVPIQHAYGYKATVTDPATTALIQTSDGYTLVSVRLNADGRETMIATVDSNPNLVHTLVLESGLVSWVSQGLYTVSYTHLTLPT